MFRILQTGIVECMNTSVLLLRATQVDIKHVPQQPTYSIHKTRPRRKDTQNSCSFLVHFAPKEGHARRACKFDEGMGVGGRTEIRNNCRSKVLEVRLRTAAPIAFPRRERTMPHHTPTPHASNHSNALRALICFGITLRQLGK